MILSKRVITQYKGMLNDSLRNAWFQKHIHNEVQNKLFADIGSGTGILSAYALEAGAKHGYLIEISKEASIIGKHILSKLGYKDKITCINDNFENITLNNVEVLISEQVGPAMFDQLQLKIWQQANKIFASDYISIPDELSVDLHIYKDNKLHDIDNVLNNCSNLPTNFYNVISEISVKPDLIIEDFISVTPGTCLSNIENKLTIKDLESATIVFVNKIGFKKDYLYLNQSSTQNWQYPPRLFIEDCSQPIRIFWNPDLPNKENPCNTLYKGYWDFEVI